MPTKLDWAFPDPASMRRRRVRDRFRDPVRAVVGAAAATIVVAAFPTWVITKLPSQPAVEISGFDHAGDGAITLVLGLLLAAWAYSDRAPESRALVVATAPTILGVAIALSARLAVQNGENLIASLAARGGTGSVEPVVHVTFAAGVVAAILGLAHLWRIRQTLVVRFQPQPIMIAGIVGGVAGALAGFVVAPSLVELLLPGALPARQAAVIPLLSIALAVVLASAGTTVGRWIGGAFLDRGSDGR